MYHCKDKHIASVSHKGDLILHNLASGTKAAKLRDPNGQVLEALDYSPMSRHLLVTAGDDGSIHLWDTTGRNPKVSWQRQHSVPTSSVFCHHQMTRKPSSCFPYHAPFSSLAFTDDGLTLAAGTSTGQVAFYDVRGKPQPITVLHAYGNSEAITSLCWQRSKAVTVNETICTDETALVAGDVGDSILMPDLLPSMASSNLSMSAAVSGSRNSSHSAETPLRSSSLTSGSLGRLLAPRINNLKDDMEIFFPDYWKFNQILIHLISCGMVARVQRKILITIHLLCSLLGVFRFQRKVVVMIAIQFLTGNLLQHLSSTFSQLTSTPAYMLGDISSSITPPEAWGVDRLSDKLTHVLQSVNMPPRFAILTSSNLSSGSILSGLQDIGLSTRTKCLVLPGKLDSLGPSLSLPGRFSSYAERIGATTSFSDLSTGSPKTNETGTETREEILNSLLSRSNVSSASNSVLPAANGGVAQVQKTTFPPDSKQENSFTPQLYQRTLEEIFGSFQKSMHEDMRNLQIEILAVQYAGGICRVFLYQLFSPFFS
ncbi:Protein NEDD1 [Olea europaea subsp. europaea]|uniref:Protein NEDD1 n=1 Tax=Olea europaea subsp. europaea TaxID=158383 RepID=A0A8S0URX9_OLEEU|nr:Protein NEDD1 [Olea europaea subsp. europaea]